MKRIDSVKINNKIFDIYKSDKASKQLVSVNRQTNKKVYFGEPTMAEFPGTKRGDNYCTRSLGIAKKFNIEGNINSPNFWSRWYLWNCEKDKSLNKRPKLL